jgi:hypothetical protein
MTASAITPFVVVDGDRELPAELRGGRVQLLTVIDIDDFELLLGLASEGRHLPDVLGQKARGPYRRLGLGRSMHEELGLPVPLMQRCRCSRSGGRRSAEDDARSLSR